MRCISTIVLLKACVFEEKVGSFRKAFDGKSECTCGVS